MANEKMIISFNNGNEPQTFSLMSPTSETIMVSFNSNTVQNTERILISGNLQEIQNSSLSDSTNAYLAFFEDLWSALRQIDCGTIQTVSFYKDDNLLYSTTKPIAKMTYDINIFAKRITVQIDQVRDISQLSNLSGEEN